MGEQVAARGFLRKVHVTVQIYESHVPEQSCERLRRTLKTAYMIKR